MTSAITIARSSALTSRRAFRSPTDSNRATPAHARYLPAHTCPRPWETLASRAGARHEMRRPCAARQHVVVRRAGVSTPPPRWTTSALTVALGRRPSARSARTARVPKLGVAPAVRRAGARPRRSGWRCARRSTRRPSRARASAATRSPRSAVSRATPARPKRGSMRAVGRASARRALGAAAAAAIVPASTIRPPGPGTMPTAPPSRAGARAEHGLARCRRPPPNAGSSAPAGVSRAADQGAREERAGRGADRERDRAVRGGRARRAPQPRSGVDSPLQAPSPSKLCVGRAVGPRAAATSGASTPPSQRHRAADHDHAVAGRARARSRVRRRGPTTAIPSSPKLGSSSPSGSSRASATCDGAGAVGGLERRGEHDAPVAEDVEAAHAAGATPGASPAVRPSRPKSRSAAPVARVRRITSSAAAGLRRRRPPGARTGRARPRRPRSSRRRTPAPAPPRAKPRSEVARGGRAAAGAPVSERARTVSGTGHGARRSTNARRGRGSCDADAGLSARSEPAISAAISATSVGVRPTRTPRASSASCLAAAVPAVPETIAPGVAHRLAGRRGEARDVGDDRLGDVLGDVLGGLLLGRAADLAGHHDQLGLGVGLEQRDDVDEARARDRVAADADDARVAEAALGQLVADLVGQRARARDDADVALLEERGGDDPDVGLAGREHAGAVRADQPRACRCSRGGCRRAARRGPGCPR